MPPARHRAVLAVVISVVLLSQVLLYPGIDVLVERLGADTRLDASMWFLAAEFGAFIAFAGVWGAASDATSRRVPFIVAGALGGALGYAALATLPRLLDLSFGAVLLLRAVQGAATIGAFSLAMTMLMDMEGGHGRNMGVAGIAIGVGTALGAPLGGQLYALGPLVPLYVASALLLCVAALAWSVDDRAPGADAHSVGAVLRNVRSTPVLAVPYTFGFIDRLTAGFFALVGTLYFRTAFGMDPATTGLFLGLFFVPFSLLQYPMGVLSDRIGRAVPVVAGSALYGLGVVLVGAASSPELAGASMVAVGVLGALMAPATMALVADVAGTGDRGLAMGGFNVFGSLGFFVGIVVGGTTASTYGYWPAFLAVGGLEVAVALLAIPVFLRREAGPTPVFGWRG